MNFSSKFLKVIFLVGLAVLTAASNEVIDKIVARVNNKVITQSDVNAALRENMKKPVKSGDDRRRLALNDLINEAILEQEIEKQNFQISDEDLNHSINTIVVQNRTTLEDFKEMLRKKGLTFDEYRKRLKEQLTKEEFLKKIIYPRIRISDHDIEEYYNKHSAEYAGYNQIRFFEIFLNNESAPEAIALEALAIKIIADLRKGAVFSESVKKYSKGNFANSGGDSGLLNISDMKPDLVNVLLQLKPGTISDPLITDQGIFIFKVVELKGSHRRPLAEVTDAIRQRLGEEKGQDELENFIQEARSHSFVEIK